MSDLLTLKEAQAALKLSRNTVLKLIHAGELVASKLGRQWRITTEDLAAYIATGRQA